MITTQKYAVLSERGDFMGFYHGDTEGEALEAFAQDAGYDDYATLQAETGEGNEVVGAGDCISQQLTGQHDMATDENVAKVVMMWESGRIADSLYNAITESFRSGNNCMGQDDWGKVENAGR